MNSTATDLRYLISLEVREASRRPFISHVLVCRLGYSQVRPGGGRTLGTKLIDVLVPVFFALPTVIRT